MAAIALVVLAGTIVASSSCSTVARRMSDQADHAKRVAARAQIRSFMAALGSYKLDTGSYPATEQGLAALRVKPRSSSQWAGPYFPQDIPLDPWAHPYVYRYPGSHRDEPDIISFGADGQEGGEGDNADIVSWTDQ
jgi:general secretion pathway protein G